MDLRPQHVRDPTLLRVRAAQRVTIIELHSTNGSKCTPSTPRAAKKAPRTFETGSMWAGG